ncbi:MAG TPA: hypothetical protein VGC96_00725 [Candidatus Elarobacter sp.]|jgi:hypothetical protein
MNSAREEERGPFPRFRIDVTTQNGPVRREVFDARQAVRIVAAATSWMAGIPFDDPTPNEPGPGPAFAGRHPSEIIEVTITRVDGPTSPGSAGGRS